MHTNLTLRSWAKSFFGRSIIYFLMLGMNISYATPAATSNEFTHPFDAQEAQVPQSQTGALNIDGSMMGLSGPFSLGGQYSSLDKFSVNAQYTKKFNPYVAASLLGEYGADMYRYGGTLGVRLFENGFGKISAEQFSQKLPFDFASGDIDKFVKQNAVGARYQQNFFVPLLRNINGGIYYSHAPNVSLDPVLYDFNGMQAINYRNIAGGTAQGADIGSDFHLTKSTELSAQVFYDHLRYDTEFTEDSEDNAQGLGGELGLKQLLGSNLAISATGSVREIYNTYTAGISWMPPMLKGGELSLLGQTIVSQNDTPDNNILGLQFGYNFGAGGAGYALSSLNDTKDVAQWANTPAVYMEQVLAVAEEQTVLLGKSAREAAPATTTVTVIEPASGPLKGSEGIIIKGAHFVEPVTVTFDGIAATNVKVKSSTEIVVDAPAHAPGQVAVQVTSGRGVSEITEVAQYTYQAPPVISKLSATKGSANGGSLITIQGKNFTGASQVKFGELEGTELKVISANEIQVKTPAQSEGTKTQVTVTTPSGISEAVQNAFYNYVTTAAGPTVTNVSPNNGNPSTTVTITGTNFANTGLSVHFGGTAATGVVFNNSNSITANAPTGPTGIVDVTVTVSSVTSPTTPADEFAYASGDPTDAPTITNISPPQGTTAGGTSVIITGTNLGTGTLSDTTVTFGGTPATVVSAPNPFTTLTVTTPAHAAGSVNVVVTVDDHDGDLDQGTSPNGYTYNPPTATTVTPPGGGANQCGGYNVTVNGSDLSGITSVVFTQGLTTITGTVIGGTDTALTVSIPAAPVGTPYPTGPYSVTLNPGSISTTAMLTITPGGACLPTATTVIPQTVADQCGNYNVFINGSNLSTITSVVFTQGVTTINGTVTAASNSQLTVSIPSAPVGNPYPTGSYSVTLNPGNFSGAPATLDIKAGGTCVTPTVTEVGDGPSQCGSYDVVIEGTNLSNLTSISFTKNSGGSMTTIIGTLGGGTDTQRTVTIPAAPAGNPYPPGVYTVTLNGSIMAAGTFTIIAGGACVPPTPTPVTTAGNDEDDDDDDDIGAAILAGLGGGLVGAGAIVYVPPLIKEMKGPINPDSGPTTGGEKVTIVGTDFIPGKTVVEFGDNQALHVRVENSTTLTAITPQGVPGKVDVKVVTPNVVQTWEDGYTYK